jgi:hypothetical protein
LWWKLAAAFAAGALLAGVVVAVVVHSNGSSRPPGEKVDSSAIDMTTATGIDCGPAVTPGPAHPDSLLSEIFSVRSAGVTYTLGWQIVPYRGPDRSYQFGTGGNLLALEPVTGGRPLGYGKGTVTFRAGPAAGTIDAVITLKAGGSLIVAGSWTCVAGGVTTTLVPDTVPG